MGFKKKKKKKKKRESDYMRDNELSQALKLTYNLQQINILVKQLYPKENLSCVNFQQ